MSNVPQKIVLKSTTKISLNERFSNIAKTAPVAPVMTSPGDRIRAQMAAQQLATAKNRRLAQQMANRPSVQAALKLKKRSLKQRLGNVQSRLSVRQNFPQGTLRGGIRGAIRGQRGLRTRSRGRGFQRGGRGSLSGSLQSLDTITSGTSFNTIHSRGGSGFRRPNWNRGRVARGANPRGNTRGNINTRGSPRGQGRGRGMRAQRSRGNQGNRGRGRGRGAPRGRGQSVSRELLDDQLEEYMSKTQSYLDAEMDQYMGGGDS